MASVEERLEVLAFLQEMAARLHKLARENGGPISPEMLRIADEIARETAKIEVELLDAGLLDARLTTPKSPNRS